jgi:hypothetical protein
MLHKNPENMPRTPTSGQKPAQNLPKPAQISGETGGQPGPEPTRYGDWENKGRCTDF